MWEGFAVEKGRLGRNGSSDRRGLWAKGGAGVWLAEHLRHVSNASATAAQAARIAGRLVLPYC